ncbi:serine/arginine repetitive matrix protein 1-like [Acropora millepora]|uniref:serine/arginine repetitive matrix protein 1-like n=1 Tax=Acropora millepora TaxID=45264 RepID=UPI001CF515BC|nr:serine/arginine repetitive matrix protein 1-like [Acropora millepora]
MEEMLIIPRAEAPELVQKHSALLMEDGRLSHAARLAARQERLLTDPTLPDDVTVEQVKPVDKKLRRAVKKLRQLQTQPLTAEEEPQERQELLTPALSKWMRRMVQAVQPDGAAPANVTPVGRRRPLLPAKPSDTPRRGKTPTPGKKRKPPSRIPVPFTPKELRDVPLKPTPARKKTPSLTDPRHLKSGITPESLVSQSPRLKKVGPPRTTRQTNPFMASLSREKDKRRRQLDPDGP